MELTYRQLQSELKKLKELGYVAQSFRLNQSKEVLLNLWCHVGRFQGMNVPAIEYIFQLENQIEVLQNGNEEIVSTGMVNGSGGSSSPTEGGGSLPSGDPRAEVGSIPSSRDDRQEHGDCSQPAIAAGDEGFDDSRVGTAGEGVPSCDQIRHRINRQSEEIQRQSDGITTQLHANARRLERGVREMGAIARGAINAYYEEKTSNGNGNSQLHLDPTTVDVEAVVI